MSDFELSALTTADLADAHRLSLAVGWPHRIADWAFALGIGDGYMARSEARAVGTVMWWQYGATQARIGMVIVEPGQQRMGLGRRLMEAGLAHLDAPSILLNATLAGEGLYRRLGFVPLDIVAQYQGIAAPPTRGFATERVRALRSSDMTAVAACDREAIGARRGAALQALVESGAAIVCEAGGRVQGYAVCRRFGRGHVIGPVAAQDQADAAALVAYWLDRHAGTFVRIDTPPGRGLAGLLDRYGLTKVDEVVTMVRGIPPATGPTRAYALANQALG